MTLNKSMPKKTNKINKAAAIKKESDREIKFDFDGLKCAKLTWLTRTLLWLAPKRGILRLAEEIGFPSGGLARKAHRIFEKIERVDVLPSTGGGRGFQIVLDGILSLYFFQDGDHFVYDGFEIGEYEKGDVTVFDRK